MFALAVNHVGIAAPMMVMLHVAAPTMHDGLVFASYGLVKGFIFGLVLAFIYDLIIKICLCCRRKSDGTGCGCGTTEKKPDMK
jgi:hypothetical protein